MGLHDNTEPTVKIRRRYGTALRHLCRFAAKPRRNWRRRDGRHVLVFGHAPPPPPSPPPHPISVVVRMHVAGCNG
jgi:hypothetical protein